MRHLVYSVRCSVEPINSSLLTTALHSSVITTLAYDDTKYWVPFMALQPSSTLFYHHKFLSSIANKYLFQFVAFIQME
jgi:hypothetical protein